MSFPAPTGSGAPGPAPAEAMAGGETLLLRMVDQIVTSAGLRGAPPAWRHTAWTGQLTKSTANGQKLNLRTMGSPPTSCPTTSPQLIAPIPALRWGCSHPKTRPRAPTGPRRQCHPYRRCGGLQPRQPRWPKPSTTDVAWTIKPERTFLRFTLVEFPGGVVTDLYTQDWNTWHV